MVRNILSSTRGHGTKVTCKPQSTFRIGHHFLITYSRVVLSESVILFILQLFPTVLLFTGPFCSLVQSVLIHRTNGKKCTSGQKGQINGQVER